MKHIKPFNIFNMNESISNFDVNKLVTIVNISKDVDGDWIYTTIDNRQLVLPKDQAGKLTLIDDKFANFVNSGHPVTKYFELDENKIIYAANFAVDAIPMRDGRVYLIERKDGRGWAIPGGFIDAGESPDQAAMRELQEETLAKPKDIKSVESLGMFKTNDPREVDFYSFVFVFHIKHTAELKFADDAKNGKWLLLSRAIKSKLAFTHHNEFLKKVNY
jgi:ADP-ribose pyrophosphatase YjhB (NUDIX family)